MHTQEMCRRCDYRHGLLELQNVCRRGRRAVTDDKRKDSSLVKGLVKHTHTAADAHHMQG